MGGSLLVGRRAELDGAVESLRRAGQEGLHVVTVVGEPGIGKTTFLDAVADAALRQGATVRRGGITAAEGTLAWAGLVSLLADVDDTMLTTLPPLPRGALAAALGRATAGEPVAAHQVAHGLAGVLQQLCEAEPLVVVVDDVQWFDPASAAALSFAVRALLRRPVQVVLAWRRDDPVPVDVEHLVPKDRVRRITLGGLSLGGIHEVIRHAVGVDLRRPTLGQVHERSGGNPLHAIELTHLLTPDGRLGDQVPASLQSSVAAHVERLSPATRTVLRTAATATTPAVALLTRVHPPEAVEVALAEANRLRVARVSGGVVRFTHPLLPTALLDPLDEAGRRVLHTRLADAVDDPEARAVHLAAAADGPDEATAAALEEAGRLAARRGATDVAADRLLRAVALTPSGSPVDERMVAAVEAAVDAGFDDEAIPLAEAALDRLADPAQRTRVGMAAALACNRSVGVTAARVMVERVLDGLGEQPRERARLLLQLTRFLQFEDMTVALGTSLGALTEARSSGDPAIVADTEQVVAVARCLVGEPVDLDAARARASPARRSRASGASWFLTELLVWLDQHAEAEHHLTSLLAAARADGDLNSTANCLSQLADTARRAGRWEDAEARFVELVELNRMLGTGTYGAQDEHDLAWVCAVQGRHDEAHRLLGGSAALDATTPRLLQMHHRARAGFVALAGGQGDRAAALLGEAHRLAEAMGFGDPRSLPFRADLAEALCATGRVADAEAVVGWLATAAARSGAPRAELDLAYAQGLLHGAQGELDAATAALERAVAVADEMGLPFEGARARLALGSVHRRAGRRLAARARLDEALDAFTHLGSVPWASRARAELDRLGRRTDATLTPTERQIATLVAEGRSNAEVAAELFVSVRTVETNLTRIYRKLGVRGRTALAARLRADGTT